MTFSFVMDASPGFTYFNKTKKVLCAIQVIKDTINTKGSVQSVFGHTDGESIVLDDAD